MSMSAKEPGLTGRCRFCVLLIVKIHSICCVRFRMISWSVIDATSSLNMPLVGAFGCSLALLLMDLTS